MQVVMKTLVLTTVNPYSKIEYQKICFYAWKAAGYHIRTLNCAEEAKKLIEAGFESQDIDIISEGETSLHLFGKAIPRVFSVIKRASHYDYDATFLTNSDIYPVHQRPVTRFLSSISDAMAMTRNECVRIYDYQFTDSIPYRGGLDIFFFTRRGINAVFNVLKNKPLAERMTYGVSGWDFYLGHHVVSQLNGKIIDGEIFLHQTHKTTYNQINEFTLYAEEMKASGCFKGHDTNEIAAEFAATINSHCNINSSLSKTLKTVFYVKPRFTEVPQPSPQASTIFEALESRSSKKINIKINQKRLINFIDSQLEYLNWSAAESYKQSQMKNQPVVTGYLFMLLTQLVIKQQSGRLHVSTVYPEGNCHVVALRQIINNTGNQERLMYIIRLFSAELVDYGIFNPVLFKYIIWSANSDYALGLCQTVFDLCKEGK
jgi:hypothetical protein